MAYKTCDDCGSRMYSGLCSYCDEETFIFEQNPDYGYSEEFMSDVRRQQEKRSRAEAMGKVEVE